MFEKKIVSPKVIKKQIVVKGHKCINDRRARRVIFTTLLKYMFLSIFFVNKICHFLQLKFLVYAKIRLLISHLFFFKTYSFPAPEGKFLL
jgi:hypothetical protein